MCGTRLRECVISVGKAVSSVVVMMLTSVVLVLTDGCLIKNLVIVLSVIRAVGSAMESGIRLVLVVISERFLEVMVAVGVIVHVLLVTKQGIVVCSVSKIIK